MEKNSGLRRPIRVLYISPNGFLGGAEKFVLLAAQAHLATARITPTILFFKDGEAVSLARSKGIRCLVLQTSFRLTRLLSFLQALKEIRTCVIQEDPAVVHNTMAYSHLVISLATLGLKLKKVWFQHGPVGGTLDKLATLFPVDYLLFNGSYLQRLHHAAFPHFNIRRGERIIRLGIDVPPQTEARNDGHELTFGMAGRMTRGKAFHRVIQFMIEENLNAHLLIAGSPKNSDDELYFKELQELSRPLDDRIQFLGHIDDMSSFYKKIDVFVHAADFPEPFGLVLAEAMGHGRLTIGNRKGGSEFLIDKETGFTYASWEELRSLLRSLQQQNRSSWKLIAQQGQTRIATDYSIAQMNEALEKIYYNLVGQEIGQLPAGLTPRNIPEELESRIP